MVDDPPLEDEVGLLPGDVHVLGPEPPLVGLVGPELLVDEGRPVGEGGLGVDDHGQRLVGDLDGGGGVDDRVLVLAEDDGHPLADVLDLGPGERPVLGRLDLDPRGDPGHRHPGGEVEILGGEDGVDPLARGGLAGVDRGDPGVGLGRADDRGVEHPGDDHVVGEAALPGDQRGVLLAAEPPADVGGLAIGFGGDRLGRAHAPTPMTGTVGSPGLSGGVASPSWGARAAASTALTMLW